MEDGSPNWNRQGRTKALSRRQDGQLDFLASRFSRRLGLRALRHRSPFHWVQQAHRWSQASKAATFKEICGQGSASGHVSNRELEKIWIIHTVARSSRPCVALLVHRRCSRPENRVLRTFQQAGQTDRQTDIQVSSPNATPSVRPSRKSGALNFLILIRFLLPF